jgi:hypothetical protein
MVKNICNLIKILAAHEDCAWNLADRPEAVSLLELSRAYWQLRPSTLAARSIRRIGEKSFNQLIANPVLRSFSWT